MRLSNVRLTGTLCFSLAFAALMSAPAAAQISSQDAKVLGMEVLWRANIQMPAGGRGIASSNLWVHPDNPKQYSVVELEGRTFRTSADQLDRKGNPIGVQGATEIVRERATRFLGRQDGFQIEQVSIPRISLVVVTRDGVVQNFDAETGKLEWYNACGSTQAPAYPAALCAEGVAVLHGSHYYVFDWKTGKQNLARALHSKTANSIAVCNGTAFVTDFRGGLTTYSLGEPTAPWRFAIRGRTIGNPVSSQDHSLCAIASENGFTYVFGSDNRRPEALFQHQSMSPISGSLASGNNAFYVGNVDGALAKLDSNERIGGVEWEHRTSSAITAPAFVANNSIFVSSEEGTLLSLADDQGGMANWITEGRGIDTVIGKSAGQVFCTTNSNQIIALDAATGQNSKTTGPIQLTEPIINPNSDRIYLADKLGRLLCLRPIGSDLPKMVVALPPSAPGQETSNGNMADGGNENRSVFGSAMDTDPTEDDADIFATDPFGGGVGGNAPDDGTVDPFGGSDPFDGS